MGFFSQWFGKKEPVPAPALQQKVIPTLSAEQFIQTAEVRSLITRYQKETIVLNPRVSDEALSTGVSKFGGLPNFNGFETFPCCDSCSKPLNFVLQLYRADFPEHYFPEGKDLFQLFRCPNDACSNSYSEYYDHKMFVYYFTDQPGAQQEFIIPEAGADDEPLVRDCFLRPAHQPDFPFFEDYNDAINQLEEQFGEALAEQFTDEHCAIQRTKIGGYPSFTQSSFYPGCSCGNEKVFFFQLSSDDKDESISTPGDWSPHQIMIGDVGNIYFYVCRTCGENSIESYWDCS